MEPILHSDSQFSPASWQVLSALKLPVESDTQRNIDIWMADALKPFHLSQDFLEKLQKSARDGAARAQEAVARLAAAKLTAETSGAIQDAELQKAAAADFSPHVHLLIYIQAQRQTEGSSWGFFWMGKNEKAAPGENTVGHVIELYLYREG
jgi:hypothetical protein